MIKSLKADERMGVGGSEGRQKKSVRCFSLSGRAADPPFGEKIGMKNEVGSLTGSFALLIKIPFKTWQLLHRPLQNNQSQCLPTQTS